MGEQKAKSMKCCISLVTNDVCMEGRLAIVLTTLLVSLSIQYMFIPSFLKRSSGFPSPFYSHNNPVKSIRLKCFQDQSHSEFDVKVGIGNQVFHILVQHTYQDTIEALMPKILNIRLGPFLYTKLLIFYTTFDLLQFPGHTICTDCIGPFTDFYFNRHSLGKLRM